MGGCGTAILKTSTSCQSASVCLLPRCGIGMDGVEWSSASIVYAVTCRNASAEDRLGSFAWVGNSSIV